MGGGEGEGEALPLTVAPARGPCYRPAMSQTDLLKRAGRIFVGGTMGEFHLPDDASMVFVRAQGSKLYDADGREYVDFLNGSGPMILGHCHPAVVAAVTEQVQRGTTYFGVNRKVIELGERIVDASPCGEKIRFVATGSDAVTFAVRMARAFTGRRRVLRFEGGWHGVSDFALHGAKPLAPSAYPRATPDAAGLPKAMPDDLLLSPFNDPEMARELIERHAGDLAAVCVEPLQRCIRPKPPFLETLRELTARHGIILIFDEVVTGFRIAWGGAQERYSVVPDLAAYGKTISGGHPNAAVCGRADVLETVNPWRALDDPQRTFVSGTFNGNPLSAAAGLATLNVLAEPGTYERLDAMADRIRTEVVSMGREFSIPLLVGGDGPVLQVLFTEADEIVNYESMLYADKERAFRFGVGMIRRGFFVSPYEKIYLSTAHTDEDLDRALAAMREVLKELPDAA